jgi:Tfp pilus assembly protein FimT
MAKLLIAISIAWVLGSIAVPALQSWELPGSNVVSASASIAQEVK